MIKIKIKIGIAGMGLLCGALLATPAGAADVAGWAVKDAPVRVMLDLTDEPSHPSAGYFVIIPDGGILPGPAPEPVVVDEAGNSLESAVLWHSPGKGCAMVFQVPRTGRSAVVYFRGAGKLKVWTPQSGLTPSAILCELYGTRTQQAARKLGELGSIGSQTRFFNQGRNPGTYKRQTMPLAMAEWRPGGAAMYLLAYVDVKDPGPTWVAPITRSGRMDIEIDGKAVQIAKKNEKRGGVGATLALTAGLHRVELYGYSTEGQTTGPVMFSWRTPKTSVAELGGERAKDVRYAGTPMFESRPLNDSEIVKSGDCVVRDIQARDGGPVATFSAVSGNVFWFGGEDAIIEYRLRAGIPGNPAGTLYSWVFDAMPGAMASGAELAWLFKGGQDTWVTLTAESGEKRSKARLAIYPFSDQGSSIAAGATREAFRTACLAMLKAYPEKDDPFAGWTASYWNNLFRVLDLQMEDPLLEVMMTQRGELLKKKLDDDRWARLQDLFLFYMGRKNPQEAIRWVQEFCKDSPPHERFVMLQLKRAEILMYYLNDLKGARQVIAPLLLSSGNEGEWARIRMGDLEFLSRHINEATQLYGEVQGRSKAGSAGIARPQKPLGKPAARKPSDVEAPANVASWKLSAIRDVAASESVGGMIEEGFYDEAYQALGVWERSFPLNKITGDFILREAKLYMALRDYKRARAILVAYCDQIDASNFLLEAMKLVRSCMIYLNEPEAVVNKYYEELLKRTQFGGGE